MDDNKNRQNTLLLTVIAVATLLVAVIGATFAYFTANISGNTDISSPVHVTAANLTIAFADGGDATIVLNSEGRIEPTRGVVTGEGTTYQPVVTKTFSLRGNNTTGTGNIASDAMRMPYKLYLIVTDNTFMLANTGANAATLLGTTSLSYKLSATTDETLEQGQEAGTIPNSTKFGAIPYRQYTKVAVEDTDPVQYTDALTSSTKDANKLNGHAVQGENAYLQPVDVYNDDGTVAIHETGVYLGNGYFRAGATNVTHRYTLEIYFNDDDTNQDYDTSAKFAGYVAISAGDSSTQLADDTTPTNPANA